MASMSAPAQRDGRNWPDRPGSRSKYTDSLSSRDISQARPFFGSEQLILRIAASLAAGYP